MNIWSKMVTALRGGVNEAGELIVDSQALRILDQEVRDATAELKQSKDGLTTILARQKLAEEKASSIGESIAEYEGYAVKAMEKGDDALALEVAEKIADLENQLDTEKKSAAQFAASANDLRKAILAAEQNIKRIKQQIDTVKATENVQRAQVAVAERHNGSNSKLRTAMDSLDRIKEKQALKSAQIKAAAELAEDSREDSLQDKLEKAGIAASGARAQDVLDRLKNKKS
ncbi:PspA/IM30 family protein [Saccharophagus degradans]|uniref:PspA/IM30 family protein n=1 Tax=Saccharophagus degradans TaxID=86304 RepID=A0AAW7XAV0_9GAMM|nr:PspA/IM30 family protein [Saccharophagus degradans]MBU2986230.1 PspA/IM30 family protein [Saccharophagus degradans]MDO6423716.1 PspA/IM30 family protein [Saccharophagus degradans]MDO6607613.1 PspA/IM30 family protein [Saccharophagus degradans]WGO99077.1 PspA/IM30 family protein [Saccharophagus degradans]